MNNPYVSIIVPLYNAEKYLCQLFETLQNQTYPYFEVLFIDDASKDKTFIRFCEKIEELAEQSEEQRFIVHQNVENLGISKTKNKALKLIKYDYVMFLDQDDLLSKNALTLLMNKIKEGADFAVGNYQRVYTYKKPFYDKMFEFEPPLKEISKKPLKDIPELLITIHQALWAKVYKKNLFENFGFDEALHGVEDLGSTSIFLAKAATIGVVEEVIYYYQYSQTSTINEADSSYVVLDTYNAYNNFYDYYEQNGLVDMYHHELEYLYVYHCVLSVLVRTYQRTKNYQTSVQQVYTELLRRFPNYKQNKYYKSHLKVSKYFIELNKIAIVQKIVSLILRKK